MKDISYADQEYMDGYFDGKDPTSPEPSGNRSQRYKHSFAVGRAELNGNPIPAQVSRDGVKRIEDLEMTQNPHTHEGCGDEQ